MNVEEPTIHKPVKLQVQQCQMHKDQISIVITFTFKPASQILILLDLLLIQEVKHRTQHKHNHNGKPPQHQRHRHINPLSILRKHNHIVDEHRKLRQSNYSDQSRVDRCIKCIAFRYKYYTGQYDADYKEWEEYVTVDQTVLASVVDAVGVHADWAG